MKTSDDSNQLTLPKGDPALLNFVAWSSRWSSRQKSETYAKAALACSGDCPTNRLSAPRGYALVTLAWQSKWRGDFDASLQGCVEAESCLPEADHQDARAHTYSVLGVLYYSRNRLDLATCATDRGFSIAHPDKNASAYVDLLATRATIQSYKGDRSRAGLTLGRARDMAYGVELARIEHNVARWLLNDGSAEKGLKHAETSLELCVRHNNRVILPYAQEVLGACKVAVGELKEAEDAFVAGLDLAIEDDDFRAQCQIISRYAQLESARDNLERARDLNRYGAEIAAKMCYPLWERDFALALADIHEKLGDFKKALASHKRAWQFEKERRS